MFNFSSNLSSSFWKEITMRLKFEWNHREQWRKNVRNHDSIVCSFWRESHHAFRGWFSQWRGWCCGWARAKHWLKVKIWWMNCKPQHRSSKNILLLSSSPSCCRASNFELRFILFFLVSCSKENFINFNEIDVLSQVSYDITTSTECWYQL